MNESKGTWRPHPFEVGGHYIAAQSFSNFPSSDFVAGETYVLQHAGYSRYDCSMVFTFHAQGQDVPVYWWWYDTEPEELCLQQFRPAT